MGQQRVNPDVSKLYITSGSYGPFMAPGTKFTHRHATYGEWECRFVKVQSTSTVIAAGNVVMWANEEGSKNGLVTNDWSTVGMSNLIAGIALVACTAAQAAADTAYICILVRGYYPSVTTNGDGDITEGLGLIHSETDGSVDSLAAVNTAPTNKLVGYSTAADDAAGTSVPTQVCIE